MDIKKNGKKIKKIVNKSKNIFIMGHKNLDLDAIGSCIGMYSILKKQKKNCYIIVDDKELEMGVHKILTEVENVYNFIKTSEIPIYSHKKNKKNLLIIVDTNKKDLVNSKKALEYFDNILIIDHHSLGKKSINKGLRIIDEDISSACEMVVKIGTEVFNHEFSAYVSTLLLAGITLDTNNFTLKTNSETFYTAYYLTAYGANPKKVQYLMKQDINMYSEQQKLLTNIEVNGNIAITKGTRFLIYRREELARTADTLLFFNNIEVSFVIGRISKTEIGISARSLGNVNISKVLEKLNGGGDAYNGAAVIKSKKISEVYTLVKKAIKNLGDE